MDGCILIGTGWVSIRCEFDKETTVERAKVLREQVCCWWNQCRLPLVIRL